MSLAPRVEHPRPAGEEMWRGEVTAELRHIHACLREVQRAVAELRTYVADELAAHLDYHTKHESRWGPVRWCEQHPFRLAVGVVVVTALAMLHSAQVEWSMVLALLGHWVK